MPVVVRNQDVAISISLCFSFLWGAFGSPLGAFRGSVVALGVSWATFGIKCIFGVSSILVIVFIIVSSTGASKQLDLAPYRNRQGDYGTTWFWSTTSVMMFLQVTCSSLGVSAFCFPP